MWGGGDPTKKRQPTDKKQREGEREVGSGWGEALGRARAGWGGGRRGQVAGDSSPEDRPQQLPFQEGKTKVTALAAPVKAGMMLTPPAKVKVCVNHRLTRSAGRSL